MNTKRCNLVDRSHYCKNGNVSPCYICGNCGNTLIFPTFDKNFVAPNEAIHCSICDFMNHTPWMKDECTYEEKELSDELIRFIKEIAQKASLEETDDLYPWSWDTKTECFERGVYDGKIFMAREILQKLHIPYVIDEDVV